MVDDTRISPKSEIIVTREFVGPRGLGACLVAPIRIATGGTNSVGSSRWEQKNLSKSN